MLRRKMIIGRQAREKAVKQTLANSALEGLLPNQKFIILLARYINGEISLESAIEYTKAQYQQVPGSTRKMYE